MPQELPPIHDDSSVGQNSDIEAVDSTKKPPHKGRQVIELLVWEAPTRQFDPKSPQWFLGLMAIAFFAIIAFAVLREVWLILLTGAIVFVYYALARVEPAEVEHRVFNTGVELGGRLYTWEDLRSFALAHNGKTSLLKIETKLIFPHSLELLLPDETTSEELEEVKELLLQFLPYEEQPHSEAGAMADHAILSLADKLPYHHKLLGWLEKRLDGK